MDISTTPLEDIRTKKVSINVELQTLELVDDLKNLLKSTRTIVFMSLLGLGISGFIQYLRTSWEKARKTYPEKKEKIDALLNGLSKIEKKHAKRRQLAGGAKVRELSGK